MPPGFDSALRALIGGRCSVEAVRREMANALFASLEPVDAIDRALRNAAQAGGISSQQLARLLEDLRQISSEEIPTDLTERTPAPESRAPAPKPERNQGRVRERTAPSFAEHAIAPVASGGSVNSTTEIRIGAVLRDRFQLTERIAGGRMGEVYRAVDRLKREAGYPDPSVAIKVLGPGLRNSPEALHLLQQEALKAQRLSHPGIVNVFDLDRSDEHYFITMEWLAGESLASLLDRARPRPMPLAEVQRILEGVGDALAYAHRQGMVHGDIKPGNIFLGQGGRVKLLDFGLARMPDPGHELESEGPFAMTRAYASCEMLEGRDPLVQDDVYALACVVYRMVAGHRPFGQRTALEAEREGLRPRRPKGLPSGAWRALRSGLGYRRKARPQTVEAFVRQFLRQDSGRSYGGWIAALVVGGLLALTGFVVSEYGDDLRRMTANLPPMIEGDPAASERGDTDQPEPADMSQGGDQSAAESEAAAEDFETLAPIDSEIATVTLSSSEDPVEQSPEVATESIAASDAPATEVEPLPAESVEPSDAPQVDIATAVIPPPVAEPPASDPVVLEPVAPEPVAPEPSASLPVIADPVASEPEAAPAPVQATAPVRTGFTNTNYQVSEGASFVRLPVRLPRGSTVPVQIRVMVIPGSARPGDDYVPPASDIVVVPPGVRETAILIPLVSDALPENIEEFSVRLFSESERIRFDIDRALVIIVDDE